MEARWLNWFLTYSGRIHSVKDELVRAKNLRRAIGLAILLVLLEILLFFVSLPLYLLVPSQALQTNRFSLKSSKPVTHKEYLIRKKIGTATVLGTALIFACKVVFVSVISFYLLGAQTLLADTRDWNFTTSGDYTYDAAKVEVTGGVARLKNLGGTTSGSTLNPSVDTNVTGWTYADWDQGTGEVNVSGKRRTSLGNGGAFLEVTFPAGSDDEFGGYWRQSFVTTATNPVGTVSFDYKVTAFDTTPLPNTFKLLVFVDTGSGAPVLGTEVWSSGEVSGLLGWTSQVNVDVASKIASPGTYYLKIAAWLETPGSRSGAFTLGYDNTLLNWSKTTVVYDTAKPTISPATSLSPTKVVTWNSFTETATKNGGEIYYQLSDDNGANWKYWNESAWVVAGAANFNTASVVQSNISAFPTATNTIRWKAFLESNGTQQVILDNIAIGYTQNALPVVSTVTGEQNTTSGNVYVSYTLQDTESDPLSLTAFEYSLTGAFAGEQVSMTADETDPNHSGTNALASSPEGIAHTFVWNALSQIGSVYDSTVYVRLRANDGVGDSSYLSSAAFAVDYVLPVVSGLSAIQTAGSTNVVFTYTLADDTSDALLTEIDVSEDAGATWTVVDTSVTGSIGTDQTTGVGKTISWAAKTDFPDQVQSDIQVRLRAKDKWQNQGIYVQSANFSLDTLSPAVLTVVDLPSQPNAGDTSVLLGGSFSESNPNTNDFFVALNEEVYGLATSGTGNTATPSDQTTATGTTLDGNDFVSGAKLTHTDDFGQITNNENSALNVAYKNVKPYTPSAPTLSNPVTTSLDLTINPHASETSGLEYAVFETTSSQWIQANGTLGATAVWEQIGTGAGQWGNNTGVAGKVSVSGLSSPVANYVFEVKSRNTSDIAHAASSESAFSSTAQIPNTAPSISFGSLSQTTDGTDYVTVNYTGTDAQGD